VFDTSGTNVKLNVESGDYSNCTFNVTGTNGQINRVGGSYTNSTFDANQISHG